MALSFKGRHYQKSNFPSCIRWYLSYKLSLRDLEEMMSERGVEVDHSTIHRWVLRYSPELEAELRKRKRPVGESWRWDEMAIKIKGELKWLYRAVDKDGDTIDFLLSAKRDQKAALWFLKKAIRQHGIPERINADKSGANTTGLKAFNENYETDIELRQVKYLIAGPVRPVGVDRLLWRRIRKTTELRWQSTVQGSESDKTHTKGPLIIVFLNTWFR